LGLCVFLVFIFGLGKKLKKLFDVGLGFGLGLDGSIFGFG
jgi:hypothetical protein